MDSLPIDMNERTEERTERVMPFVQDEVLSHSWLFSQQTPLLFVDVNEKVGKNKVFSQNNGTKMVCDDMYMSQRLFASTVHLICFGRTRN